MKLEFGDTSSPASRAEKIRKLFKSGQTVDETTRKAMDDGVWTESEDNLTLFREHRREVRDVLGDLTPDGLPWAGPTALRKEDQPGQPVWRQLVFWSKADYDYNYTSYKRRERQNAQIAANIARNCISMFGVAPTDLGELPGDVDE